jgi:hypothetical protein
MDSCGHGGGHDTHSKKFPPQKGKSTKNRVPFAILIAESIVTAYLCTRCLRLVSVLRRVGCFLLLLPHQATSPPIIELGRWEFGRQGKDN